MTRNMSNQTELGNVSQAGVHVHTFFLAIQVLIFRFLCNIHFV